MTRVPFDANYGRVKVWSILEDAYVWMTPIDAREGMFRGGILAYSPEHEPIEFGDADRNWVNLIPADHLPDSVKNVI